VSPTVYTFNALKVKIHSDDHNPPHVHVEGKGCVARFDLRDLSLMSNTGFHRSDIARIRRELRTRVITLMEIWNDLNE
jgi:hypothetical protein